MSSNDIIKFVWRTRAALQIWLLVIFWNLQWSENTHAHTLLMTKSMEKRMYSF